MSNIVERLNENIIADAFERKAIADGALCERLIRERKEAADTIEALRAENARLRKALNPFAVVAEMTIGESEDDRDLFRPARNGPRLIVADFRKARAAMGESDD